MGQQRESRSGDNSLDCVFDVPSMARPYPEKDHRPKA